MKSENDRIWNLRIFKIRRLSKMDDVMESVQTSIKVKLPKRLGGKYLNLSFATTRFLI